MNHADLAADLPFYANGTLSADRSAAIERELESCEECLLELQSIDVLRDALIDAERGADDHDAENLLRDLWLRIDAEAPAPGVAAPQPASAVAQAPTGARPRRIPRRIWQVGGGFAAALVVAVGLSSTFHNDGASQNVSGSGAPALSAAYDAAAAPPPPAEPLSRSEGQSLKASESSQNAPAPPPVTLRQRQLARTAEASLIVTDVNGAIARVTSVANLQSGVVTNLVDDEPHAGSHHVASVTISVPAARFDATMAALEDVGTFTSRTEKTEDLTGAIVDADARLRNLRREETDLLKIMDRSGKISDVLSVEQELATTRQSIEQLDGENQAMKARVAESTIAIQLADGRTSTPVKPGIGTQISNQWSRSLSDMTNFSVRQLGRLFELVVFSPWIVLVVGVAFLILRRIRAARARAVGTPAP